MFNCHELFVPQIDIYSLSMVMIEVLTGIPPIEGFASRSSFSAMAQADDMPQHVKVSKFYEILSTI